jgi:hypothetical protein
MSHAVGVAVTSSSPSEVLIHCLPRPPPSGTGFQPSTEYPHTVIDLSVHPPFVRRGGVQEGGVEGDVEGEVEGEVEGKHYVVTLCAICSSGEIVLHLHHVKHRQEEQHRQIMATMNNDLLGIDFGDGGKADTATDTTATHDTTTTGTTTGTATGTATTTTPAFVLMSFNVNGVLNNHWSTPTAQDFNPHLLCDSPLLSMDASRRSPIVVGGTANGQVLFWHARDLTLLACYTTGGFAVHSLSLCPTEEFVAVGCDAGVLVTFALPNCRDGADPSVTQGSGGMGRVESVKKKVGGAARLVTKNVGAVAGSAVNGAKRLFANLWGKK